MSREDAPNLVNARCCGECEHGDFTWDDGKFAYCEKYKFEGYSTEVCSEFKMRETE